MSKDDKGIKNFAKKIMVQTKSIRVVKGETKKTNKK